MALSEVLLFIEDDIELVNLYGMHDAHMSMLRRTFEDLTITSRGNMVKFVGDKKRVQEAKGRLEMMVRALKQFGELSSQSVTDILQGQNPFATRLQKDSQNVIVYGRSGKPITPRTRNHKRMVELAEENDVLFAIGPAGTGKTYMAVALAVRALKNGLVRRIILARPAVEAGENLGFLPGDLKEKIDPYLRPLYDALDDMIPAEKLKHFMETRIIEIAPLAFMRGRTLDNAFIILDEAQNATDMQLKMFLTRLGPTAKCIVTGDLSQVDLPHYQKSGLVRGLRILQNIEGIAILHLDSEDVVRHRLVKAIVNAFDHADAQDQARKQARKEAQEQKQEEQTASETSVEPKETNAEED